MHTDKRDTVDGGIRQKPKESINNSLVDIKRVVGREGGWSQEKKEEHVKIMSFVTAPGWWREGWFFIQNEPQKSEACKQSHHSVQDTHT